MTAIKNMITVLRREWDRIRRFPVLPVLMFVLPLVAFIFFADIFRIGVPRDIPVAVFDDDKTSLSRTLVTMIDATPSARVDYKVASMHEGEKLVREGKVSAVVYVPSGFEKDILGQTGATVSAYISGLNITANGLLGKDIQQAVTTFTTGVQIQLLVSQGLSEEQAYNQVIPLYFDSHILFNPYTNYGYYLLPSFMPMMLMIFTIILTVFSVGAELKNKTAGQWLEAGGGMIWPSVIGKLLPYTAAMFIMSLLMNTIMYKWLGVPLNGSAGMLILAGFMFVLAYQSIGLLLISVLANLRMALSIGGGYSVLAFTFSGLTFPLIAMDPLLRAAAYIFPFTVYTEVFIDQAMRGAPAVYSLAHLGWLSLYIILPLLCLPRLKRISADPKYWGRV